MTFQLYIQSNSPGELSTWVQPFIEVFKQKVPDSRIHIFISPCQYASGQETEIAKAIPGVDSISSASETFAYCFNGLRQLPFPKGQGAILFLGGDALYTQLLSWRLNIPAYAYTEHRRFPKWRFKRVFKKQEDGDLMGDRVLRYRKQKPSFYTEKALTLTDRHILFLCGSRPQHFYQILPTMIDVARIITKADPAIIPLLLVSPFIAEAEFNAFCQLHDISPLKPMSGNSLDYMSIAHLIVTIPGSSTAEAMYLRRPLFVFLPTNKPELFRLDGIVGLLWNRPLLGPLIRKIALRVLREQIRFFSLPNRIANTAIVPEFVGHVTAEQLAQDILNLLKQPEVLEKMSQDMRMFFHEDSVAEKITAAIIEERE